MSAALACRTVRSESAIIEATKKVGLKTTIEYDEAAFYGPKIDIQIYSVIGREFTLATNQVDFAQGRRFKLSFTNQNNQPEVPLIIHRAPLGTHERFIGFLLEHYAGKFPTWLAPMQVKILPISDKFMDYANTILNKLKKADIRAEIDDRNEKIGKKIRDTELARVPYMLVVGEKEMNEGKADWQLITYAHCGHTFTNPESPEYNEAMAKRAWQHTLQFLKEVLQRP